MDVLTMCIGYLIVSIADRPGIEMPANKLHDSPKGTVTVTLHLENHRPLHRQATESPENARCAKLSSSLFSPFRLDEVLFRAGHQSLNTIAGVPVLYTEMPRVGMG